MLNEARRFMAVGAHCDDVDIRCGGTFARLSREGKSGCYVVAVENAYTGKHCNVRDSREALAIRHGESERASAILGAARLEWLEFQSFYFSTTDPRSAIYPSFKNLDTLNRELEHVMFSGLPPAANADRFPVCRERFGNLLDDFDPDIVFTHSPDDRHQDHYAVSRFVETMVAEHNRHGKEIDLYFWEPGSRGPMADFRPDTFVELSHEDVDRKQQAIDCYASQLPDELAARFAEERATAYGNPVGLRYCEGFRKAPFHSGDPWRESPTFLENTTRSNKIYALRGTNECRHT